MKYALSLSVILGLALVSQANDVKYVVTDGSVTVDVLYDQLTPPTVYPPACAYIVTLKSPRGIYNVDGRIDGTDMTSLVQTFSSGGLFSTPNGEGLSAADLRNDTHILVPIANQVFVRPADEDKIGSWGYSNKTFLGTTLCGSYDSGDGTNDYSKTMVLGFTGLADYTNIPFARVVVTNDAPFYFNFNIVDGNGDTSHFDFGWGVGPEPMSLSLFGASALALIRRRR